MAKRRKSATLKEKHYQLIIVILSVALATSIGFILTGPITGMAVADPNYVGKKVVGYINDELVQPGTYASLVEIKDAGEYYIVTTEYMGNRIDVYATKDGNLFFLNAFDISDYTPSNKTRKLGFDAPNREIPDVKLFVMSYCPFGNQAENAMAPVVKLLGDKADIKVHYIVSVSGDQVRSLHGDKEAVEDMREACIQKYMPDKFWDYLLYTNKNCSLSNIDTCWLEAADYVGIDSDRITRCVEEEGLDLMKADEELSSRYGVTGSPTLIINDMRYAGARTPEAYKQAICSGFMDPPEECEQTLSSGSGSASGQC